MIHDEQRAGERMTFEEFLRKYRASQQKKFRMRTASPKEVGREMADETLKLLRQALQATIARDSEPGT